MGEILGLGVTHFPPLSGTDENMGRILKRVLDDPALARKVPAARRLAHAMRQEYGTDDGVAAARATARRSVAGFRNARRSWTSSTRTSS